MQFIDRLDSWALNFVQPIQSGFPIKVFKVLTTLGEWWFVFGAAALITIILLTKKDKARVFVLWLIILGTFADVFILKKIIHRQRPFDSLVSENSFSFPSAHGAFSIALYGFIAYLLWKKAGKKFTKIGIVADTAILAALIGFSRIYLDVHYLSDVLGGYIIGAFWLALGIYISQRIINNES